MVYWGSVCIKKQPLTGLSPRSKQAIYQIHLNHGARFRTTYCNEGCALRYPDLLKWMYSCETVEFGSVMLLFSDYGSVLLGVSNWGNECAKVGSGYDCSNSQ